MFMIDFKRKTLRKAKILLKKICLFFISMLWVNPSFAVELVQDMDVTIGLFDAAKVKLQYEEKENRFRIGAEVKTANFFDTLYPFIGEYASEGEISVYKAKPYLYQTATTTRSHTRTKKIFYNEQGVAYKRVSTKDKKKNETAINNVPPTADAADLQSVFAELIFRFQRKGDCQLQREIYDGKKHYKLIAESKGQEQRFFQWLNKKEKAELCSVYIENLKDNNDNILWDVSADKPIKLWLGRDEKTKMPFVMEIVIDSTPLGALKVTPTRLNIK